jgi:2-dehydro-3-deoxygalactonokinase
MPREFLSCDWGTSSFRIRWIRDDEIVREFCYESGCKQLFDENPGELRAAAYQNFLQSVFRGWRAPADPIPLVISGMASSSIGWKEIPYASAPLKLDGSNLHFETIDWNSPAWISTTYLISGVATESEIMRGEETEALGLLREVPTNTLCVLVLPGTHSKHLVVEKGEVQTFSTYMTGELFELLTRHSVLRATTDRDSLSNHSQTNLKAFRAGVWQAMKAGLGASLFQTRTRGILEKVPARENTFFLSGVLIGAEMADCARRFPKACLYIGGAHKVRSLYASAASILDVWLWDAFNDEIIELSVPKAHGAFLDRL